MRRKDSSAYRNSVRLPMWLGILALFLGGMLLRASAQVAPPPLLSTVNPLTANVGSAGLTLTVTGSRFGRVATVQWNGRDLLTNTSNIANNILTAEVTATDLLAPGTVLITVKNDVGVSNPFRFTVLPARPMLTSITPNVVAQGGRQIRVTLTGRNFRPGAKVNLSTPIEDGQVMSTDAVTERVSYVNDTTLIAIINVSDRAATGIKYVDVVNPDGTNTGRNGSGTSLPLRIEGQSSLAAPAQTNGIALVYPRNGTVIAQNEPLIAEAIVGGVGTGTIAGQWLWDGNVVEQFTTNLTAGERVPLKNMRSLPTQIIGPHTLSLRIIAPNQLQTIPIKIIVTPGTWQATRLLLPAPRRVVKSAAPPMFEWAIVPGAVKYQIGFTDKPYFNTIQRWIDVGDAPWQVPGKVWESLPTGKLYWTVRTVEATGNARPPALLRTLWKLPDAALQPSEFLPGEGKLRWQEAAPSLVYRVTVSTDAEAKTILRRFLTTDSAVNLVAVIDQFVRGQEYYWRVEAFAPNGTLLQAGTPTKFLPHPAESLQALNWKVEFTWLASVTAARQQNNIRYQIASLNVPPLPAPVQETSLQFVERTPAPQQTIAEAAPILTLQLKDSLDGLPFSVVLDDTDVTALARVQGHRLTCPMALPLNAGEHTVTLKVEDKTAQWTFTVAPNAGSQNGATAPKTDAEDDVSSGAPSEDTEATRKFHFNYEITSNTQAASGSEQEANVMSLALQASYRDGPWLSEVNGTIALNSLLNPTQMGLQGLVNDYVFRLAHIKQRWNADVRFGLTMPQSFLGSEFVTTAFPRLGAEAGLNTPIGGLTLYRNVDDKAPGVGEGLAFHQTIQGASYVLPLPKDRVRFRLLWLSSEDRGAGIKFSPDSTGMPSIVPDPLSSPAKSDSLGGLLQWQLGEQWQWTSEYALASFNPNHYDPTSVRQSGRAWRSQLAGLWRETAINLGWRDVTPGFLSNLNAAYTPFSPNNRRGLDFAASRATTLGRFAATYQFLQSDLRSADHLRTALHHVTANFSRTVTPNTVVTVEGDVANTATNNTAGIGIGTGTTIDPNTMFFPANQLRMGIKAAASHHRNNFTFTVDGTHNWFRDRANMGQRTATTGLNVNGQWQLNANFQLVASYGLTAINAAQSNTGNNRAMSVFVQPVFTWRRAGLTMIPLFSYNKMSYAFSGVKTEEMQMAQYGGRIMWQLPKRLRFSTFSFEASMQRLNPSLQAPLQITPRILFNWTMIWPPPAQHR